FFINPPLGFEGDNGLWLQADRIRLTEETALGSAEINIRTFSKIETGIEPMIGFRYINFQERFSFLTDDDNLSFPGRFGLGDPTRVATYSVRVKNNLLAPQVGGEYQKSIIKGVAVGFYGKAALGVDIADITHTLTRGDGTLGFKGFRQRYNFSQVFEIGAFLDVYWLERLRVRAGYTALWLTHVPQAGHPDASHPPTPQARQHNPGMLSSRGPPAGLRFLFSRALHDPRRAGGVGPRRPPVPHAPGSPSPPVAHAPASFGLSLRRTKARGRRMM